MAETLAGRGGGRGAGLVNSFAALDAILAACVKNRRVDYRAVEKRKGELDAFLESVAAAEVRTLSSDEQLAFFINAYNGLVLRSVIAHSTMSAANSVVPRRVIDVPGFFDKQAFVVAGESLTLNLLEEKRIRRLDARGVSADPRIHFAVNCASHDCPPLAARAYLGTTLAASLEAQTSAYLARPGEVALDTKAKRIIVVQLFEWYAADFGGEAAVRAFIARYAPAAKAALMDETWELDHRPYDWTSNAL